MQSFSSPFQIDCRKIILNENFAIVILHGKSAHGGFQIVST